MIPPHIWFHDHAALVLFGPDIALADALIGDFPSIGAADLVRILKAYSKVRENLPLPNATRQLVADRAVGEVKEPTGRVDTGPISDYYEVWLCPCGEPIKHSNWEHPTNCGPAQMWKIPRGFVLAPGQPETGVTYPFQIHKRLWTAIVTLCTNVLHASTIHDGIGTHHTEDMHKQAKDVLEGLKGEIK